MKLQRYELYMSGILNMCDYIYPERQHRQGGCLTCRNLMFESRAARGCTDLYVLCASGAQGVLPCTGWEVTESQLDQPSLTPLSVAGCG